MPQQRYAIRCSTEEQARECDIERANLWTEYYCVYSKPLRIFLSIGAVSKHLYKIITYEEAKEKGLLGEKKDGMRCLYCGEDSCSCTTSKKYGLMESPSEDNLVEKLELEPMYCKGQTSWNNPDGSIGVSEFTNADYSAMEKNIRKIADYINKHLLSK